MTTETLEKANALSKKIGELNMHLRCVPEAGTTYPVVIGAAYGANDKPDLFGDFLPIDPNLFISAYRKNVERAIEEIKKKLEEL